MRLRLLTTARFSFPLAFAIASAIPAEAATVTWGGAGSEASPGWWNEANNSLPDHWNQASPPNMAGADNAVINGGGI